MGYYFDIYKIKHCDQGDNFLWVTIFVSHHITGVGEGKRVDIFMGPNVPAWMGIYFEIR